MARLEAHFAGMLYRFTAHTEDIFHASVNPEALRRKLRDAARTSISTFGRKGVSIQSKR